eukprot:758401-Hanusia_phi.AAC.1
MFTGGKQRDRDRDRDRGAREGVLEQSEGTRKETRIACEGRGEQESRKRRKKRQTNLGKATSFQLTRSGSQLH